MNPAAWHEKPTVFECEGDRLVGIATIPDRPIQVGVLIVVGGPQYRAGSHRQFTLLARQLAEQRIASLRFDYRGMGDSEGEIRDFEAIDPDINAAIASLLAAVPELHGVVIWGLCDAASAALIYAHTDPRVRGLILLNPWAHSETAEARARLHRYYPSQLFTATFWLKLVKLEVNIRSAFLELTQFLRQRNAKPEQGDGQSDFTMRMLEGIKHFKGEILVILSGKEDLTAQMFSALIASDPQWRAACRGANANCRTLQEANHTFSKEEWRDVVGEWTITWIRDRFLPPSEQVAAT